VHEGINLLQEDKNIIFVGVGAAKYGVRTSDEMDGNKNSKG
jgi:hypothetical protein